MPGEPGREVCGEVHSVFGAEPGLVGDLGGPSGALEDLVPVIAGRIVGLNSGTTGLSLSSDGLLEEKLVVFGSDVLFLSHKYFSCFSRWPLERIRSNILSQNFVIVNFNQPTGLSLVMK